ncbi:DUF4062 domain-containing protein [Bacillus sp. S3]|uniref:DUF4062 domain-containing protein n=1 Tax=Bacillus sp. S3 TaxID=486398 RepID=UPI0016809A8A|nr:DUF4062 domain-containing protein [Bacillus sp. S3]
MINKTRIFISSAYEEDLKSPRKIIKEHLEDSGYEVPIFEAGDFGTWEKDTLQQCLTVVRSCDIFVLLINKKSGANSTLMRGNVTPTYLEYQAALQEKKHILVFVNPEVKNNFMSMKDDFKRIFDTYVSDHHRLPSSPFDPIKDWVEEQMRTENLYKRMLQIADPFVWAFLYDVYSKWNWLYEYDIAHSREHAKNISAMLSTSLKSVVKFISERDEIDQLKTSATYLLEYADITLDILKEKNEIKKGPLEDWSRVLQKSINFLSRNPIEIVQARDFNPLVVNTIQRCHAASLYSYNGKQALDLIGTAGDITANDMFSLDETDVFVVSAFNNKTRLFAFRQDKQCLYITEPIGNSVLCLHFNLDTNWTKETAEAYMAEIEYAIINQNELFFDFMKLVIGGRS